MLKQIKILSLFLPHLLLLVNGQTHFDPKNLDKVSEYFEELVEKTQSPCLIVGFSYKGSFTWSQAFGPGADLENHIPCTEQTMLRVASVSKAIGSSLIAHMVEEGKLDWDDPISSYLTKHVFPQKTWEGHPVNITIRQLITHQSGIRHSNDHDYLHDWEFRIFNSTDLLQMFENDPLLFKPGHGFHYSNHGWSTLGAIVEAIEERPYHVVLEEFMKNEIGMPFATSETRQKLIKNRGQQYYIKNGVVEYPIAQNILRPYPHWPAGHIIATVEDLLIYGEKMLKSFKSNNKGIETLLKPETVEEMWTYINPHVKASHYDMSLGVNKTIHIKDIISHYVLGWDRSVLLLPHIDSHNETVLEELVYISHTGQIESVNAKLAIFPEHDFVFACIVNRGELKELMNEMPIETIYNLFH